MRERATSATSPGAKWTRDDSVWIRSSNLLLRRSDSTRVLACRSFMDVELATFGVEGGRSARLARIAAIDGFSWERMFRWCEVCGDLPRWSLDARLTGPVQPRLCLRLDQMRVHESREPPSRLEAPANGCLKARRSTV
jgi:hypothetical protein